MTPATLGKFEGRKVDAVGIEIRNSAGGLNEALKVDPAEWHLEDEVVVVLRCKVTKIRHDPLKDTDGLRRVHILDAEDATVIEDDGMITTALDEQKKRIELASGVQRLPIELVAAHEAGEHKQDLIEECPKCLEELAAQEKEERGKK